MYQHDPRHVDVFVESLGLEKENALQTPIVDDVKDENPARLDADQPASTGLMWPDACSSVKTEQTQHSP